MHWSNLPGGWRYCDYYPHHDWQDSYVQWNDIGIVFTKEGPYRTAFFEAFPTKEFLDKKKDIFCGIQFYRCKRADVETFIRGEGRTIREAEENAWKELQIYLKCPKHEFERRDYENGYGICKYCGMGRCDVIDPIYPCAECGKLTWYHKSKDGKWYCREHAKLDMNMEGLEVLLKKIADDTGMEEDQILAEAGRIFIENMARMKRESKE